MSGPKYRFCVEEESLTAGAVKPKIMSGLAEIPDLTDQRPKLHANTVMVTSSHDHERLFVCLKVTCDVQHQVMASTAFSSHCSVGAA